MAFRVTLSAEALADLQKIHRYLLESGDDTAPRIVRSILQHMRVLENYPLIGPRVRGKPNWRKMIHTPYVIYYRVFTERKSVEIVHFWHGRRRSPKYSG